MTWMFLHDFSEDATSYLGLSHTRVITAVPLLWGLSMALVGLTLLPGRRPGRDGAGPGASGRLARN